MALNEYEYQKRFLCYIAGLIIGPIAFIAGISLANSIGIRDSYKHYKSSEKVELGYIPTSSLEIKLLDQNENHEPETVLEIDGTPYLLKYDPNNNPRLLRYHIEPKNIIPPRIVIESKEFLEGANPN